MEYTCPYPCLDSSPPFSVTVNRRNVSSGGGDELDGATPHATHGTATCCQTVVDRGLVRCIVRGSLAVGDNR